MPVHQTVSRIPMRKSMPGRPALGPPDVYPQDPNQKEDELSAVHVKQGFTQNHSALVSEEYASLLTSSSRMDGNAPVKSNKVLDDLKSIMSKKEDMNTLADSGRRKQSINTRDFWLVTPTPRNKLAVDNWFKELSANRHSFSRLLRRVPIFNKREEVLVTLRENEVPTSRAIWYVKLCAAYASAMTETNKTKKRQASDPSQEWTHTMTRFLKDQLQELLINVSSTSSDNMDSNKVENTVPYKNWIYTLELCEHMYNQGLLDRQEFLQWVLEMVEKCKYADDPAMRLVMPILMVFAKEFCQNELLSRKLAYQCARKITYLVSESDAINNPNREGQGENQNMHPVVAAFMELTNDPYTRFIILGLSSVLQQIGLDCPSALVWHYFGENKTPSSLLGSPLDHLPNCAPSGLPMPSRQNNPAIRHRLRLAETIIKDRSKQVEEKWSVDPNVTNSKIGSRVDKNLSVLEILDAYNFDRIDSSSDCLETLYTRLFGANSTLLSSGSQSSSSSQGGTNVENTDDDVVIVHTLCEWAVTSMRSGEHRCFVVAKLLERRQSELAFQTGNGNQNENNDPEDDKNSESELFASQQMYGPPLFQARLFHYLDTSAPKMDNAVEFSNLILLFYELICHDVFSHDSYLCTLISRGDVMGPMTSDKDTKDHDKSTDDAENSFDDSKIDGDLTNLLNQIKEGNQLSDPFSPTNDKEKDKGDLGGLPDVSKKGRHWQYVYHFPLPQDENSTHECNQRNVLLYGVGRGRDDASRNVKKIYKDVTKLFSKKFSIDVSDGGKVKKHNKGDVIFDQVIQRFQNLSYYDQHYVSYQCGQTMIEMLSAFANSNANYLPLAEYVSFLFDLTGLSLNIQGILDWCLQILKELPGVESQLSERGSCLTRSYTTTLSLYIVGVLRKYHTIFLLNQSDVVTAFEQLSRIAFRPKLPMETGASMLDCNSAEWCILAYLHDLSLNCSTLKNRDKFADLKRIFSASCEPSMSLCTLTDKKFGLEYIANPRKKVDPLTIKLLIENPQNQYNLVCNVLMEVCGCNDNEKLNDIAILCCEFTAQCPSLSSEWLGALTALCYAGSSHAYQDLLQTVPLSDQSIYNRLGVFVSILIARHCFQVQAFVSHVAIPSLLKAWDEVKEGHSSREAEVGARLSCHLLLMLFQSIEGSSAKPSFGSGIKHSCDRQLLANAVRNITVGLLIAVLKVILVLGDAEDPSKGPGVKIFNVDDDDDDDDGFSLMYKSSSKNSMHKAKLSDFAKHTLKQICNQEWVHNRCLQSPSDLLKNGILLDPMLSSKQAQKLLRLICMQHKNSSTEVDVADDPASHRRILTKILENLDEWNLRISTVDIKLMYHQLSGSSSESGAWLDAAAMAIVDIFSLVDSENPSSGEKSSPTTADKKSTKRKKFSSVWIIPYLVRNLKFLQSRVLKVSSQVLECGDMFKPAKNSSSSGGSKKGDKHQKDQAKVCAGHQPFLQLILTCLRELDNGSSESKKQDREEQKENLLNSLHTQLSTYCFFTKDDKFHNYEDGSARKTMQDALQLRFSLVGGVFDTICRNLTSVTEWCTLLVQLVVRGVVDLTNNSDLFTIILDMVNIMIHSTLINDREAGNSERNEENKKHYSYHTLVKKLKKEIGEKNTPSLKYLRQLLPLPKIMTEVIVTEPFGIVNEKGTKVKGLNCDKKPGMQVSEKQKISPWDIMEGHKTPAPLSWAWFGAVKHERKPMKYEEGFQELKYASLGMEKPKSYFLDPPPLPPEDLEPASNQYKDMNKMNAEQMMMANQMMPRGMMMQGGQMSGMNMMGQQPMMNQGMRMGPPGYGGGPPGPGMSSGNPQMMGNQMMGMNPGMNPGMQGNQMMAGGGGYGQQHPNQRMPNTYMAPNAQQMQMQRQMGPRMMQGGMSPGMNPMGAGHHSMPPMRGPRPMMQGSGMNMYPGPGGPQGNQMPPGGNQWNNNYPGNQQQYVQPPYHSPQMGSSRYPTPPQAPQGRIGNPKQALQDMIRARNTDPQFNSGNHFMPPGAAGNTGPPPPGGGRTSFPMRPSIPNRMPSQQTTMYGNSGNNPPPPQYSNTQGQFQGNFQGQGQNQYSYNNMMQQGQPGQRPPPPNFNQMRGGAGGGGGGGYPMQQQRGPAPGGQNQYANQGFRHQQPMGMNQNQQQQNMMRMQNPQLMAQLQRGPGNMGQNQNQMGGYGGPQGGPQQGQNRF